MRTLLVTIAVTIGDDGKTAFTINENVGDTMEVIQVLRREIAFLEEEWRAAHAASGGDDGRQPA